MNCPRCNGMVLAERERDGIVVDVCPQCRGVWLDRGELERLQARAAELDHTARDRSWQEPARPRVDAAPPADVGYGPPGDPRGWRRRDDDDDDDDDDRRRHDGPGYGHGHPPRRGGWRGLFDLFD